MPDIGAYSSVGFVELSDADPASGARNLFTQIFEIAHVQTVTKENFNSWKISNHCVQCRFPATLQASIDPLFAGTPVYVWVRFGMVSPGETYWRAWEKRIVTAFDATRRPGGTEPALGHMVWIETSDLLYTLKYGEKTVARSGTISDIVTQIARENKIDANAVIEPTTSKGVYFQSFQSDFDFVTKRMIPRAVNAEGRAGYQLAIIDDVLHFHTLGYGQKGIRSRPIDYFSSAGLAIDLHQTNRMPLNMEEGAAGIVSIVADPLRMQPNVLGNVESSTEKALVLTPPHQGFQVTPVVPASYTKNLILHIYENGIQEVAAQAQHEFDRPYQTQFCVKFNYRNQPKIRLFDFLDIIFDRSNAWSGTYYVGKIVHDMNQGNLLTTVHLYRGQQIADQLNGILIAGSPDQNFELSSPGDPDGVQLNLVPASSTVVFPGGGDTVQISRADVA